MDEKKVKSMLKFGVFLILSFMLLFGVYQVDFEKLNAKNNPDEGFLAPFYKEMRNKHTARKSNSVYVVDPSKLVPEIRDQSEVRDFSEFFGTWWFSTGNVGEFGSCLDVVQNILKPIGCKWTRTQLEAEGGNADYPGQPPLPSQFYTSSVNSENLKYSSSGYEDDWCEQPAGVNTGWLLENGLDVIIFVKGWEKDDGKGYTREQAVSDAFCYSHNGIGEFVNWARQFATAIYKNNYTVANNPNWKGRIRYVEFFNEPNLGGHPFRYKSGKGALWYSGSDLIELKERIKWLNRLMIEYYNAFEYVWTNGDVAGHPPSYYSATLPDFPKLKVGLPPLSWSERQYWDLMFEESQYKLIEIASNPANDKRYYDFFPMHPYREGDKFARGEGLYDTTIAPTQSFFSEDYTPGQKTKEGLHHYGTLVQELQGNVSLKDDKEYSYVNHSSGRHYTENLITEIGWNSPYGYGEYDWNSSYPCKGERGIYYHFNYQPTHVKSFVPNYRYAQWIGEVCRLLLPLKMVHENEPLIKRMIIQTAMDYHSGYWCKPDQLGDNGFWGLFSRNFTYFDPKDDFFYGHHVSEYFIPDTMGFHRKAGYYAFLDSSLYPLQAFNSGNYTLIDSATTCFNRSTYCQEREIKLNNCPVNTRITVTNYWIRPVVHGQERYLKPGQEIEYFIDQDEAYPYCPVLFILRRSDGSLGKQLYPQWPPFTAFAPQSGSFSFEIKGELADYANGRLVIRSQSKLNPATNNLGTPVNGVPWGCGEGNAQLCRPAGFNIVLEKEAIIGNKGSVLYKPLPIAQLLIHNQPVMRNDKICLTVRKNTGKPISLDIYDISGRRITQLVDKPLKQGTYFYSIDKIASPGIFIIVLRHNNERIEHKKLLFISNWR